MLSYGSAVNDAGRSDYMSSYISSLIRPVPLQASSISSHRATPMIPQTIPAVAIPLLQPLLLATPPKMMAKGPRMIEKQRKDTMPQTIAAIARPLPGWEAGWVFWD